MMVYITTRIRQPTIAHLPSIKHIAALGSLHVLLRCFSYDGPWFRGGVGEVYRICPVA
jgi:hypothetical protein